MVAWELCLCAVALKLAPASAFPTYPALIPHGLEYGSPPCSFCTSLINCLDCPGVYRVRPHQLWAQKSLDAVLDGYAVPG